MKSIFPRSQLWLPVLLTALLVGCATSASKIWPARVGNYTYDQAVVELGPPDKQAKLADGTQVADWLTHCGYIYTDVTPGFYGGGPHHRFIYDPPIITQNRSPDYFLRLTFGPDGRLQSWKQYTR